MDIFCPACRSPYLPPDGVAPSPGQSLCCPNCQQEFAAEAAPADALDDPFMALRDPDQSAPLPAFDAGLDLGIPELPDAPPASGDFDDPIALPSLDLDAAPTPSTPPSGDFDDPIALPSMDLSQAAPPPQSPDQAEAPIALPSMDLSQAAPPPDELPLDAGGWSGTDLGPRSQSLDLGLEPDAPPPAPEGGLDGLIEALEGDPPPPDADPFAGLPDPDGPSAAAPSEALALDDGLPDFDAPVEAPAAASDALALDDGLPDFDAPVEASAAPGDALALDNSLPDFDVPVEAPAAAGDALALDDGLPDFDAPAPADASNPFGIPELPDAPAPAPSAETDGAGLDFGDRPLDAEPEVGAAPLEMASPARSSSNITVTPVVSDAPAPDVADEWDAIDVPDSLRPAPAPKAPPAVTLEPVAAPTAPSASAPAAPSAPAEATAPAPRRGRRLAIAVLVGGFVGGGVALEWLSPWGAFGRHLVAPPAPAAPAAVAARKAPAPRAAPGAGTAVAPARAGPPYGFSHLAAQMARAEAKDAPPRLQLEGAWAAVVGGLLHPGPDTPFSLDRIAARVAALKGVNWGSPDMAEAKALTRMTRKAEAGLALLEKKPRRALKALKAVAHEGDDPELNWLRGLAHRPKDLRRARRAWRAALQSGPHGPTMAALAAAAPDPAQRAEWYIQAAAAGDGYARAGLLGFAAARRAEKLSLAREAIALAADQADTLSPEAADRARVQAALAFADVEPERAASWAAARSRAPGDAQTKTDPQVEIAARVALAKGDTESASKYASDPGLAPEWQATIALRTGAADTEARIKALAASDRSARLTAEWQLLSGRIHEAQATLKRLQKTPPPRRRRPKRKAPPKQDPTLRRDLALLRWRVRHAQRPAAAKWTPSADLAEAAAIDPGHPKVRLALAEDYSLSPDAADRQRARAHFAQVLSSAFAEPARSAYADALERWGDHRGAGQLLAEMAALHPGDTDTALRRARLALRQTPPAPDLALEVLNEIEARLVGASHPVPSGVWFWKGRTALVQGDLGQAELLLKRAEALAPKDPKIRYWLGQVYETNNSLFEAIRAYERAVQMAPSFAPAHRALGRTSLERNHFARARKHFQNYLSRTGPDADVLLLIAQSYSRENKDRRAAKYYERVLKLSPDHALALLELGRIHSRAGQEKAAIQKFRAAAKADPSRTEAWCLLGLSLGQRRLTTAAKKALERCTTGDAGPEDLRSAAADMLESPNL